MAVELVPYRWDDVDLMRDPPVKTPSAATVRFAVADSGEMEIDLSEEHLKAYRQVVDPMLAAARPARDKPHAPKEPGKRRDEYWRDLRVWAKNRGIRIEPQVNGKGRNAGFKYPMAVVRQYDAYLAALGDAPTGSVVN